MLSTCDSSSQSIRRSLQDDLLDFQETFAKALGKREVHDLESVVQKGNKLVTAIKWSSSRDLLDKNTASLAYAVASSVKLIGSSALELEGGREDAIGEAMLRIESLLLDEGQSRKRQQRNHVPRLKRYCRGSSSESSIAWPKSTFDNSPKPSEPPIDHTVVRLWFLDNLAYPYPTAQQKDFLAKTAGIQRSQVDSDLTNYRRRAGWTDIMNVWCGGDRNAMKKLMNRVEKGKEQRKKILDAVQGCRDYLTMKENNKVGDWIKEITQNSAFKYRFTGSLPDISAASPCSSIRPCTPRSFSGSSATSSTSSCSEVSEASAIITIPRKRRYTGDESISPFKRVQGQTVEVSGSYEPWSFADLQPMPPSPCEGLI
uniref:SXI1D alpha n=1 Tax=Cryptococcus deneoformans TaxID=40410 RepID=B2BE36_9TREE|nr:SXI1D alpha [Cryptococcus neoformans var. neoformans]